MITQRAFIDLLRQHATASQRKRRSYADFVNVWLLKWNEQVEASDLSDDDKTQQMLWAANTVRREYGTVDPLWSLPE